MIDAIIQVFIQPQVAILRRNAHFHIEDYRKRARRYGSKAKLFAVPPKLSAGWQNARALLSDGRAITSQGCRKAHCQNCATSLSNPSPRKGSLEAEDVAQQLDDVAKKSDYNDNDQGGKRRDQFATQAARLSDTTLHWMAPARSVRFDKKAPVDSWFGTAAGASMDTQPSDDWHRRASPLAPVSERNSRMLNCLATAVHYVRR